MALAVRLVGWLMVLALFAFAVLSQGNKIANEWQRLTALAGQLDPAADFTLRVASVRGDLPSRGHVHVVLEPPSGDAASWLYVLAQNELAPLVLDPGSVPGRFVVLTEMGPQLDGLLLRHKWQVVRRAGPNVAVIDTVEAEPSEKRGGNGGIPLR